MKKKKKGRLTVPVQTRVVAFNFKILQAKQSKPAGAVGADDIRYFRGQICRSPPISMVSPCHPKRTNTPSPEPRPASLACSCRAGFERLTTNARVNEGRGTSSSVGFNR